MMTNLFPVILSYRSPYRPGEKTMGEAERPNKIVQGNRSIEDRQYSKFPRVSKKAKYHHCCRGVAEMVGKRW